MSPEGTWALCCSQGRAALGGSHYSPSFLQKPPSLEPAALAASGQASLSSWEKGRHCPNFPNATNSSFSFKAFHPLLDSGRGRGDGGWEGRTAPLSHSPRFDSLYEHDPPIRNQGLISQLTASSSIISIQTN